MHNLWLIIQMFKLPNINNIYVDEKMIRSLGIVVVRSISLGASCNETHPGLATPFNTNHCNTYNARYR